MASLPVLVEPYALHGCDSISEYQGTTTQDRHEPVRPDASKRQRNDVSTTLISDILSGIFHQCVVTCCNTDAC